MNGSVIGLYSKFGVLLADDPTDEEEIPDFASHNAADRKRWAEAIIAAHIHKIEMVTASLKKYPRGKATRTTQIRALKNSLKMVWLPYRETGYPRQPGAPAFRPLSKYV